MRKLVSRVVLLTTVVLLAMPMTAEAKSANRVELNCKSKMTLYSGESTQLEIKGIYQKGKKLYPNQSQKALWKKVMASSSNKSIATIGKDGKVTAKRAGTVRLSVTSRKNRRVKTTVKLTVKKTSGKPAITLSGKRGKDSDGVYYLQDMKIGESTAIKVKSVKGLSSKSVTFKSDNKKVATVSKDGKVTAVAEGEACIKVTSVVNEKVSMRMYIDVESSCDSYGHTWGEWKYSDSYGYKRGGAPTCTEDGLRVRECIECGKQEYEDLPALGHDFVFQKHVEAVKGVTGGDSYVCSRCGEEDFRNPVYYQPTEEELAAAIAEWQAMNPTLTKWGAEDGHDGCNGFADQMQDYIFGANVPRVWKEDVDPSEFSKIRVGDVLHFYGTKPSTGGIYGHFVVVTKVVADGVWEVAEGNFSGVVCWDHVYAFKNGNVYCDMTEHYNIMGTVDGWDATNAHVTVGTRWY